MRTIAQLMSLAGRKALVTGAAGHIGGVIGQALAELGARTALLDLDAQACRHRAAELQLIPTPPLVRGSGLRVRGLPSKVPPTLNPQPTAAEVLRQALGKRGGRGAVALACDLRDEAATRRAIREGIARLEGLDILVHCAAYVGALDIPGWAVPFDRQRVEAWEEAMRVNLTAAFVMVQEARRALARSGRSSVIFFSSIYGLVGPDWRLYEGTGMANPAAYHASKGGLLQLTRYLATMLAPRVRVNAISPGGVERRQPAAFRRRYRSRAPLGRMAREEDLKGAVAYLASDLSAYVTGQNLVVDGGWTIW